MKKDLIIDTIKKTRSVIPDDRLLDGIMAGLEKDARPLPEFNKPVRRRVLKPVVLFLAVLCLIASSLAVTAAVNEDIRDYLVSLFGGNPNSVIGEKVNASVEQDGFLLNVDAVVAEGNSLFMIYTLNDRDNKVIKGDTSLDSFSMAVNGDSNFTASHNTIIRNGEKNYILLTLNDIRKGVQKVDFSIKGFRSPDETKTLVLPAGTTGYKPEGAPGTMIDSIDLVENRIQASFTITDESSYKLGFNIKAKNVRTGKTYSQKAEEYEEEQDGTKKIRWYSEELDGGDASDYVLVIPFDKVYTLNSPLDVSFKADFSNKPVKVLRPTDARFIAGTVDKVTVYQMSMIVDVIGDPRNEKQEPQAKPIPADRPFYENAGDDDQEMRVIYEDGQKADIFAYQTNMNASQAGENRYRFYLVLRGALDFSRKPVLHIGECAIQLY